MKARNGDLFVAERRNEKLAEFTGTLDRLETLVDWSGLAAAVNTSVSNRLASEKAANYIVLL